MEQFNNRCLSCLKPLEPSQKTCDECDYINIETESLNERLFLMYFKYLEDNYLNINNFRADKLSGKSNFDFDVPLDFLDQKDITGGVLSSYISVKYPDLFKNTSFAGIGFQPNAKSPDEKNIELVKRNLLEPITKKIRETYSEMDFVDEEFKVVRPYVFLTELYDKTSENVKLRFTFSHLSDFNFREQVKNHKNTEAYEIAGLQPGATRLEKLMVIKEKALSKRLRNLASFIYDLESAMGHIDKCEMLKNLIPAGGQVLWTELYSNSSFNEQLVQILSYKTHFPYLNRDHKKNFRNELNLQTIAETLRSCSGKSKELDPWIYLACEEVGIHPNVEFDDADAVNQSDDYRLSLSLATE